MGFLNNEFSGKHITNERRQTENCSKNGSICDCHIGKIANPKKAALCAAAIITGVFAVLVTTNAFSLKRNLSRGYIKYMYAAKDAKKKSCDVLFIGDSITWLLDLKENFPGRNFINRGISGDKTTDILKRCSHTFKNIKAEKIILLAGINDLFPSNSSSREVLDNLYEIVSIAKTYNHEAEVFVESIYPVNNRKTDALHDVCTQRIHEVNRELRERADEKGYTYIDMYSVLVNENDGFTESYTYDGLHPNKVGYKIISQKLREYIDKK